MRDCSLAGVGVPEADMREGTRRRANPGSRSTLFVAQGYQGVDADGAAGRDIAGEQRDACQAERDEDVGERVSRLDAGLKAPVTIDGWRGNVPSAKKNSS